MNSTTKLIPLSVTASRLHVPATWLRAEAEAGRIPHLRAGKRLLFDLVVVERILLERARIISPVPINDGGRAMNAKRSRQSGGEGVDRE